MFERPARQDRGSRARRTGVRLLVLAVAAMSVAAVAATTYVSSLSLSTTDIAAGRSSTGTVGISFSSSLTKSGLLSSTKVDLSSNKTTIVKVPSSIYVKNSLRSGSFSVQTASRGAGCATISARVSTSAAKTALVYVEPPATSGFRLTMSPGLVVGGSAATGQIVVTSSSQFSEIVVKLTSDNSLARVPSSVTVPAGKPVEGGIYIAQASFGVPTSVTGANTCAVIGATSARGTTKALLKIVSISG